MKRKGFILIFGLGVFIFLSLLALSLGFRSHIAFKKTRLYLAKIRANALASGGINIALKMITDDDAACDYYGEAMFKPVVRDVDYLRPAASGRLTVAISDESSLLDINMANAEILTKVFNERQVLGAAEKIDRLLDYVDEDKDARITGSESDAKNAPLAVTAEAASLPGFGRREIAVLEDFFSPFNGGKVNINTVSKDKAVFFCGDQSAIDNIFSWRLDNGLECFTRESWENFLAQADSDIRGRLDGLFDEKSDFLRVTSVADVSGVEKKITCVIKRGSGIIYWYEE